jgi:aquaporin TIP
MARSGDFSRFFIPPDWNASLVRALYAEFLGTLLFTLFAGLSDSALGYALSYTALVYATQQISGGHLNPAVTFALMSSGLTHWVTGVMYMLAQVAGAVVAALVQAALVPGLHVGHNKIAVPSCFAPSNSITNWELFGWEAVMTFVLVYVVYAVAVAEPGHGSLGPLALGITIYVARTVCGVYTGAALNPALVLGPAIVFLCTGTWWIYLAGEFVGSLLAAVVGSSIFQFGIGRRTAYDYEAGVSGTQEGLLSETI